MQGAGAALTCGRGREIILAYEAAFARALGARVVEKPAVTLWMVLIPILFLHYMHRHQQFKAGVEGFAREYLKPRLRALDAALGASATDGEQGGTDSPASLALRRAQAQQEAVLTAHYRRLLACEADGHGALLRAAYGDRARFEQYLEELGAADAALNAAILEAAPGETAVAQAVARLDSALRQMRREEAMSFISPAPPAA
ncbi:MAG: NF038143 family protein [Sulfuritalea sp.]|nr:NF038143 family protein [Sulfuritalea sp.]